MVTSETQMDEKGMMAAARHEAVQRQLKKLDDAQVWHLRLSHAVQIRKVASMLKNGELPHAEFESFECSDRLNGKFSASFSGPLTKPQNVGHLHVNLKTQVDIPSKDGH